MTKNVSSFNIVLFMVSIVFVLLGLYSIIYPSGIIMFFSYAIGAILIFLGINYIYKGIINKTDMQFPFLKIFMGIIFFILGITFIIKNNVPYLIFAFCFGVWAISVGSYKLWVATEFRKQGQKCIWLLIGSILHILFGIAILIFPVFTTNLWIQIFGFYWVFLGLCMIASLFSKSNSINLLPF